MRIQGNNKCQVSSEGPTLQQTVADANFLLFFFCFIPWDFGPGIL